MAQIDLIGRGLLVIDVGGGPAGLLQLRYEVDALGMRFFRLEPGAQATSLFVLIDTRTPNLRKGSISLAALPASPFDAFFGLSLTYTPDEFTLKVAQPNPFCQRGSIQLRDLTLAFTVRRAETNLSVTGGMTAVIAGRSIRLNAALADTLDLTFSPAAAPPPVAIFPSGSLDLSTFRLSPNPGRWNGLQVQYAFDEGAGASIRDTAGVDSSVDLIVQTKVPPNLTRAPRDFVWIDGAISIDPSREELPGAQTFIKLDPGPPPPANQLAAAPRTPPVKRLIDAWAASGELTVEGWMRPVRAAQAGPAAIFSVAKDENLRLVEINHGAQATASGRFSVAQRTSITSQAGSAISTADTAATTNLTYMVYTRDASGNVRLFLDGVLAASGAVPGRLFGNDALELAVLSEPGGAHPWAGELHQLALYDRAMTAERVHANQVPSFTVAASAVLSDAGVLGFTAPGLAFNTPTVDGRVRIDGDQFSIQGTLKLFPDSSPVRVTVRDAVPFDALGTVNLSTPAEVALRDFTLAQSRLTIQGPSVTLSGLWLGQPASFQASRRNGDYILSSTVGFVLPFTHTLLPIVDPVTGARLTDRLVLQGELAVSVAIELSSAGFLARVKATFALPGAAASAPRAVIPEFQISAPPLTRNALLDLVLDRLDAGALSILADLLKNDSDYYFGSVAAAFASPPAPSAALGGAIFLAAGANARPASITIALPAVFASQADVRLDPGSFHLAQTGGRCTLTIDSPGQTPDTMLAEYKKFLRALATLPAGTDLLPGAVPAILARIAERLPVPFSSLLYYHYGFDPKQSSIDLQPGMRLRVEYQHYQLVHPSDHTGISGFVGGNVGYYEVNSYSQASQSGTPQFTLGFNGYLSNLQMKVATDPSRGGAGGVIDLQQASFRRAYYRLFYPGQFAKDDGGAWTGSERVATLIGADKLADLEAATTLYLDQGKIANTNSQVSFFFRGRAAVVPEIPIFVGERLQYVPVGTTVRHLLETHAGIPAAGLAGQNLKQFRGSLRPRRLIHDGVDGTPSYRFMDFDTYQSFDGRQDIYDLPVVKGDRFYL